MKQQKFQIDDSELMTPRGKIVSIGRLFIPKMGDGDFDHVMPMLSFVVIEENKTSYITTCIHLQIDGYGETKEASKENMVSNVLHFLEENFYDRRNKKNCWANVYELSKANERMGLLWNKYHAIQFMRAERGLSAGWYIVFENKIKELEIQRKKIESLEREVGKLKIESSEAVSMDQKLMKLYKAEYKTFIFDEYPVRMTA
jgi:hypothetical protein